MTEAEREELIEKIARHLAVREDVTPDLTAEILAQSSWCNENWHCWIPEARAALAVAEPVIREWCARVAEKGNDETCWTASERAIAAAIRGGGGKDE